jgi:hypothetical protein
MYWLHGLFQELWHVILANRWKVSVSTFLIPW